MNIEGDLVLIYYKDESGGYARIERITANVKKGCCQVNIVELIRIPFMRNEVYGVMRCISIMIHPTILCMQECSQNLQ